MVNRWIILSVLVLYSTLGWAGAIREETNQNVQINEEEETSWPITDVRIAVAYRLLNDLNEAQKPKRFDHLVSPELSGQVKDWFRASVGFTTTFYALGNNIPNEPDNPAVGDLFGGVMRAVDLGERHSLFLEQYAVLPTSGASRFEGYKGSSVTSARLTSFLWPKRLALINMVRLSYIFNTYEFSPVTRESSDEWDGFYNAGLLFLITRSIRVTANLSTQYVRQLNGGDRIRSGNSLGLSYVQNSLLLALTYSNSTYPDDYRYDVFTRDDYRQMVSLRTIYEY
jgi:hypothetical protein